VEQENPRKSSEKIGGLPAEVGIEHLANTIHMALPLDAARSLYRNYKAPNYAVSSIFLSSSEV
jgi:hypothetical protein